ncbi:Xaa-Pro dipeptidyl-peptidase [Streptomyces sp. NPDC086549]|uniref:Xaa-Pro dipeptidyl-peptidase n=1 Tax=Streptomyces sp. NPDC086549 TaxID=3365752 RepID=UPI003820F9C9
MHSNISVAPSRKRRPWRLPTAAAVAATVAAALLVGSHLSAGPTAAGDGRAASPSGPTGESKPVYSYAKAVRETVWVDTGLDADRDGKTDRVAADIVRPREPAATGRKIPVIMEASPYYSCCGRGNENQKKTYDAKGRPVRIPLFYDNYFVPRGYAFVAVDLPGTGRSDGCTDAGGLGDVLSAKAVVDWLNGRAKGYTARTGTTRARASWSNGATGMIGKSWDGSIANGVAATGVRGLKTIVPISSISSWYEAYFEQGVPLAGSAPNSGMLARMVEREDATPRCTAVNKRLNDPALGSGDWAPLWSERDYTANARNVGASVFVVHGLQDVDVRPNQLGKWWDALADNGVERKIWLSQTGHVDPFDYRRAQWVDTLHRWFDHELLGYDNGIDREPMADIERTPGHWTTDVVWPPKTTSTATLHPARGAQAGVGILGTQTGTGNETFTDDPSRGEAEWAAHIGTSTPEKAGFTTPPLTKDLRLSGSAQVTVTATPTTATAHLSAVLVDLGPATIRDYDGGSLGITTRTGRDCWGSSTGGDSACYRKTAADSTDVTATVVSRGWADLGTCADARKSRPLTPGKACTLTLDLAVTDHVVPAGHRLALVVAGTNKNLINPPADRPTLTLDLARTSLRMPVVGGGKALRAVG